MKTMRRNGLRAVWILLGWVLAVGGAEATPPAFQALVAWVADGDTVILQDGRRIRYVGLNCPETAHGEKPAEPFGVEARRMNRELVDGRRIRCVPAGHDRYGRLLAEVFLADGISVNQALLAAGLGYVLPDKQSAPCAARLLAAQRQAMAAGKGIWERLDRRPQRLVGNRRSQRFHRLDGPDTQSIKPGNRVTFTDVYQAFAAGYTPCRRCFPRLEALIRAS